MAGILGNPNLFPISRELKECVVTERLISEIMAFFWHYHPIWILSYILIYKKIPNMLEIHSSTSKLISSTVCSYIDIPHNTYAILPSTIFS